MQDLKKIVDRFLTLMKTENISIESEDFYVAAKKLGESDEVKKLKIFGSIIEIERIIAEATGYWIRPKFKGPCRVVEGGVIIPQAPEEVESVVDMWTWRIIAPHILEQYLEKKIQTSYNGSYDNLLNLIRTGGEEEFYEQFFKFHYMRPASLGIYRRELTEKILNNLETNGEVLVDASFARKVHLEYIPEDIFDTPGVSSFACEVIKNSTGKLQLKVSEDPQVQAKK